MGVNLPIPNVNSPFKFWCQKALPLVYDDSLSYYEVLCKLTKYVNGLRDDVILLGKDVSDLNNLYNELKALVEKYYEHGIQSSVDKKLDEMAENGYFENILAKYVSEFMPFYYGTTVNMLLTNLHNGAKVTTAGYHKPNDGGACDFIITNSDNGYSLKMNNGLYAMPIIKDYITPEIFGAYGDNIHIDTVAIQKALNYTIENNCNFKATPNKTYLIDAPLEVEMFDVAISNTLYKYGKSFDFTGSIITSNTIIACGIRFKIWQSNDNRHYIEIKNINIDGNNEKIHTGVWFEHLSCTDVVGVTANNVRRGVLWSKGNESTLSQIFCRRCAEIDITLATGNWVDKLQGIFEEYATNVGYTYPKHQNILDENGYIDVTKTDCNGIEINVNDSFVDTAIIVDFVVSFNMWGGGDNYINKLHGWNYSCATQALSSAIVVNASSNWYTNCIFDHYRIGLCMKFNIPIYISQCNFTNGYVADIDTSQRVAYNFYATKKNSYRERFCGVYCSNTRFAGDMSTTVTKNAPITKMFNIDEYSGDFINCSIWNIYGVKPNLNTDIKINDYAETDTYTNKYPIYGKLKTKEKIIPLIDSSNFTEYVGNTYNAGYNIGDTILRCVSTKCTNIEIDANINNSASVTITPSVSGSNGTLMTIIDNKYDIDDVLLVSLKYKTANNVTITPTINAEYIGGFNNNGKEKTFTCVNNNEWNICTFICKVKKIGNICSITIEKNGVINISDFRIYNLKKGVKRYYIESNEQYANRLIKRFGTEMIDVTLSADTNLSFISTTLPIEFYDVYSNYYNKYKIRYNTNGSPIIYNSELCTRFCDLPIYPKNGYIYILSLSTSGQDIVNGVTEKVYPEFAKRINATSEVVDKITNGTYGYTLYPESVKNDDVVSNTYTLSQTFPKRIDGENPIIYKCHYISQDRLIPDCIVDENESIPLYPNGEQYLVYKNSENITTLPTVFVEYIYPTE